MDKEQRKQEIRERLGQLPKGNITYKNIKGKKQPYLQWTENGKAYTQYVKLGERERIQIDLDERRELEKEIQLLETYSLKISQILKKHPSLQGHVAIGSQNFSDFRKEGIAYVDKTRFIRDWWYSDDQVTLITRPRRFGKTLMMSTVESFFSNRFTDNYKMFKDLEIGKDPVIMQELGQYPVIFFTFGSVKTGDVQLAKKMMCSEVGQAYSFYEKALEEETISQNDRELFEEYEKQLRRRNADYLEDSINVLSEILYKVYGKKVIILMDEYDTPMQEAYCSDYWDETTDCMRRFMNITFKSNPYIERGLITGITRVAKESMFSDMNHVIAYTVTSDRYADCFGFTEQEVMDLLTCNDVSELEDVKRWYDGFRFGSISHIYNPWSIVNYMSQRKLLPFWVDTGGYGLIGKLLLNGDNDLLKDMQVLLNGGTITTVLDENITFRDLERHTHYFWPLLLAVGGVTIVDLHLKEDSWVATLRITNRETSVMYHRIVNDWFAHNAREDFCEYLLKGNLEYMNWYMNDIAMYTISMFDTAKYTGKRAPEHFYHGFVLGLVITLRNEYAIDSNRESGIGRYDVMMRPKKEGLPAIIMEFKVRNERREESLADTVRVALKQIEDRGYEQALLNEGYTKDQIRKYGFAFEGKEVLISDGTEFEFDIY